MVYVLPAADVKPPESMDLNSGTIAGKEDQKKLAATVSQVYKGLPKQIETLKLNEEYFSKKSPIWGKPIRMDTPWKSVKEKPDGPTTDLFQRDVMRKLFDAKPFDFGSWISNLVNRIKGKN